MIDATTARQGLSLLSTLIGEIMEDTAHIALVDQVNVTTRTEELRSAGADIGALAAAMDVLARRGEP